jgi:hypothetical protein
MSLAHTYIDRKDLEAILKCLKYSALDANTTKELEEGLAWLNNPDTQKHLETIYQHLKMSGDYLRSITIADEGHS